jgi:hypothetical protein
MAFNFSGDFHHEFQPLPGTLTLRQRSFGRDDLILDFHISKLLDLRNNPHAGKLDFTNQLLRLRNKGETKMARESLWVRTPLKNHVE